MKATTISTIGLDREGASIGLARRQTKPELPRGFACWQAQRQPPQTIDPVSKALSSLPQVVEPADMPALNLPLGKMTELLTAFAPIYAANWLFDSPGGQAPRGKAGRRDG